MNHFLMTSLRSQQLSMQLASTVGLRVRRAGGVCSQAACHMLFLTISRCWGCRIDSQRPRQLLLPAMLSQATPGTSEGERRWGEVKSNLGGTVMGLGGGAFASDCSALIDEP